MTACDNRLKRFKKIVTLGALTLSVSALPLARAMAVDDNALPSGGTVVGGSASLNYNGNNLDVHQSTNRAVINWNSFNIGRNATTTFHQPNSNAMVVNRVTGGGADPTQILGAMRANGKVIVLDQNGVIFGHDSVIDVGSIIVSTGNIDTNAFMGGGPIQITGANTGGAIVNNGAMTVAEAGIAAFVAPVVQNNGVIQAKMGKVSLAAGDSATLDLYGDGLIELAVDEPLQNALVENNGVINAEGGTVLMTAAVAKEVVNNVINMSGIIDVSSVSVEGGKIILEGANTEVSGRLEASGKGRGGDILIGGDYKGGGDVRHADKVTVTSSAQIKANAKDNGDGGKVIVWSDKDTKVAGTIEAQGANGGKGGLVETSSKEILNIGLDASIAVGPGGEWLLDPEDITISNSGNDGNANTSDVAAATINATLNGGGNVTITTGAVGPGNGDIVLSSATINKSTTNNTATLTLQADRNIVMTGSSIGNSSGDALNVVFNADRNADQSGAISVTNSTITTNGGYVVMGGGSGAVGGANGILGDGDGTGADDVAAWGNAGYNVGIDLDNGDISTGAGAIFLKGHGYNESSTSSLIGVRLKSGASLLSTDGNITLHGTGGNGTTGNTGVYVTGTGAASSISSTNGDIKLTGFGGSNGLAASNSNYGVQIYNGVSISSTGTTASAGDITITGTGGAGEDNNSGLRLDANGGATTKVSAKNGNIYLYGFGGNSGLAGRSGNHGVSLVSGLGVETTLGDILIQGTGGTSSSTTNDLSTSGATAVNISSTSGDILLDVNTIDLVNTTVQTSGDVTVKPRTASTSINLGGPTAGLSLSDSELSSITAGRLIIGDSASGTGDVVIDSWDLSGKTFDLEIYGNDITVQDTDATVGIDYGMRLGTGDVLLHAKDNAGVDLGVLTLNADITKSLAGTSLLDLRADRDIIFGGGADITSSTGFLNVVLNADRDADQDGAISLTTSTITTNGGYVVMGGGSGAVGGTNGILGDGDGTGADDVAAWGNSTYANGIRLNNGDITTDAGAIYLNGHGMDASTNARGLYLHAGSRLNSTTGVIALVGTGGAGDDSNSGMYLDGSGTEISSTKGDITLIGHGGSSGAVGSDFNYGVWLANSALIQSLGTASDAAKITIEAVGGNGDSSNRGFILDNSTITSVAGDIEITGTAQGGATNSNGIRINNSKVESTGSADIDMTGIGVFDFSISTGTNVIGGADATGDITLNGDNFGYSETSIETDGTVFITPRTASMTIGLGGGTGLLNLSDAELASITAGRLVIGDSASGTGDIVIDSWDLSGKIFDLEIYGNDITVQDTDATVGVDYGMKLGAGDARLHARDNAAIDLGVLTVNADITKSLTGTSLLDLRADRDIVFNSGADVTATTGLMNVIFNADRDADQDGSISLTTSAITTNGGYVVMGGGSGDVGGTNGILGDGDGTGADDVTAWGNATNKVGITLNNGDISTGTGRIIMNGHGYNNPTGDDQYGIYQYGGSLVETGTGAITYNGVGGDGDDYNYGVYIGGAGTIVRSSKGAMSFIAQAGSAGVDASDSNHGFFLYSGAIIDSTGTGTDAATIYIEGTGGGGEDDNQGVRIASGTAKVQTKRGDIEIVGTGGGLASIGDLSGNAGLRLNSSGQIIADGDADITITANHKAEDTTLNGIYANSGTIIVGGATATGNITFNSDYVNFANHTIRTTGKVSFVPITNNASVGLGTTTGTLSLTDAELAGITAGTLIIGSTASTGDVTIDTWDLSAKTHNVQLYGNDMNIAGLTMGSGDVTLYAKGGGIQVSADSISNASGDLNLLSRYGILIDADVTNAGTGAINLFAGWDGTSAITTPALFDIDNVRLGATLRDLTIGTNGSLSSGNGGTAIVAATSGNFINNSSSGANALHTPSGRYLVYAKSDTTTVKGGLGAASLGSMSYNANTPSSIVGASRFIFKDALGNTSPGPSSSGGNTDNAGSNGLPVEHVINHSNNVTPPSIGVSQEMLAVAESKNSSESEGAAMAGTSQADESGISDHSACLAVDGSSGFCVVN